MTGNNQQGAGATGSGTHTGRAPKLKKKGAARLMKMAAGHLSFLLGASVLLSSAPSLAATVSYSQSFSKGWNLAGNSLATPINVKSAFGSQSNISTVWKWDASGSRWAFYAPTLDTAGTLSAYAASHGYTVLASINPGEGFWVNTSAPASLGTQSGTGFSLAASSLATGWNLAATGDSITPAAFAASAANVSTMWAWDNANSAWYFYAPSLAANNTLAGYIKGRGYEDFGTMTMDNGLGVWVNYASGGSTGSTPPVVMTGSAIDAPIPGAVITITSGAPLNDPGALSIGTVTANTIGQFTISVTLPAGNVPIFANAADPINTAVELSSFLGLSGALSAAGSLSAVNLPDLDITPVTTAALAVYGQINGGNYAGLTSAAYATTQQLYSGDILAIAAAIKAVGDNLCTPAIAVSTTTNLAASIAAASNLTSGNSTTLSTAAATLGGNCPAIIASLPQVIEADPQFNTGLHLGDVISSGVLIIPAGTYALSGIIAESGMTSTLIGVTANPASVFNDTIVTIAPNGLVTSADGNVSGTVSGNLVNLTVIKGAQHYTLQGSINLIQAALVSGGAAYSIQSGGTNAASGALTNFAAVLSTAAEVPVWNGIAAPLTATQDHGATCNAGAFAVRLNAFGADVGGGSVGECVAPNATGWSMSASTTTGAGYNFDEQIVTATPPILTAPAWSEVSAATPFILGAPSASFTRNGVTTTGTMYYVMGATFVVLANGAGNSILNMDGNMFQYAESAYTGTAFSSGDSHSSSGGSGDSHSSSGGSGDSHSSSGGSGGDSYGYGSGD